MLVYKSSFALNLIGTVFYVVAMFYLWQTIFLGQPGALGRLHLAGDEGLHPGRRSCSTRS